MARMRDEDVTRIKREVDLAALVRESGVELAPHGKDLIGLCPFHEDRDPSLIVTQSKNLWHCLGACNAGGSVIDWVMRAENMGVRPAIQKLARRLGIEEPGADRRQADLSTCPLDVDLEDAILLGQVVDYYHQTVLGHERARAYLAERGLNDVDAIKDFRLGFADRSLGPKIPKKNAKAGAKLREQLTRLGVLKPSGHERFTGYLVFPLFDGQGHVVGLYGRKANRHSTNGEPVHMYLPGPRSGIWNPESFRPDPTAPTAPNELILCESIIDALTFRIHGFHKVSAIYGGNGFTDEHLALMQQHQVHRVHLAFDRDDAGEAATERVAARLAACGIESRRVKFPIGMDANEFALQQSKHATGQALQHSPASKALRLLIDAAQPSPEIRVIPVPEVVPSVAAMAPSTGPSTELRAGSGQAAKQKSPVAADETEPAPTSLSTHSTGSGQAPEAEVTDAQVMMRLGDRVYRVRGLERNKSFDVMKINLRVSCEDVFHVDTLDLYNHKLRTGYINAAADELELKPEIIKRDLGRVLLKLEQVQEARITKELEPVESRVELSPREREEALAFLKDPALLSQVLADFETCGVVGETTNKLVGYLAAVSRKLESPLAVIIQSSSAAGKTALMEAVLAFMPTEERVKYSAMTGQSLFYMGETNLKQKILAIVEEEGAEKASYAIKLLQSEGELTIASTGKDPESGRMITHEYRVEGPVMIFLTTTAIEIDEELLNRCLVLTVNEGREQTQAIHHLQRYRETLDGRLARLEREQILTLHRNAQRLLRSLVVVNPWAEQLTFLDDRTRTRRDHMKYLTLIRACALLYQHQREVKTAEVRGQVIEYIEVSLEDIGIVNQMMHQVLGRSLDELPPQTRNLLEEVNRMVTDRCSRKQIQRKEVRFTRHQVREFTGWSYGQVRIHLDRLVEFEYVLPHRGGRGQQFVYELVYNGKNVGADPQFMNLIEVQQLQKQVKSVSTTDTLQEWNGSLQCQNGSLQGQAG